MSCGSEHEEEVRVLLSTAAVEVAKGRGVGDNVHTHAHPDQAAKNHARPSLLTLNAPAT